MFIFTHHPHAFVHSVEADKNMRIAVAEFADKKMRIAGGSSDCGKIWVATRDNVSIAQVRNIM
jgi:hypothetical protein